MNQSIFILTEEGEFVGAYTTREKALLDAADLRNWHIIETRLR